MNRDPNNYPKGWNRKRVQAVIDQYDKQSDEQAAREIEQAEPVEPTAWMQVPVRLVPEVKKLLGKRRKSA